MPASRRQSVVDELCGRRRLHQARPPGAGHFARMGRSTAKRQRGPAELPQFDRLGAKCGDCSQSSKCDGLFVEHADMKTLNCVMRSEWHGHWRAGRCPRSPLCGNNALLNELKLVGLPVMSGHAAFICLVHQRAPKRTVQAPAIAHQVHFDRHPAKPYFGASRGGIDILEQHLPGKTCALQAPPDDYFAHEKAIPRLLGAYLYVFARPLGACLLKSKHTCSLFIIDFLPCAASEPVLAQDLLSFGLA